MNLMLIFLSCLRKNTKKGNNEALGEEYFWLIDPLDGTKSYIKRKGDFTVNIAMIQNDKPVGGVIYAPLSKTSYFTAEDGLAYKQVDNGEVVRISVKEPSEEGLVVVASLSHRNEETDSYINSLGKVKEIVPASSSLKFCLVAEGVADIYPRLGPTMEWDTGAGHAILNAAGGRVEMVDGSDFVYRKKDKGLLNPNFVAKS